MELPVDMPGNTTLDMSYPLLHVLQGGGGGGGGGRVTMAPCPPSLGSLDMSGIILTTGTF